MRNRTLLLTAVTASLAVQDAAAAVWQAALVSMGKEINKGLHVANISSSTATFSYDDVTNLLTQTGGTFNARWTTAPTSTLYRMLTTGLVMGDGGTASAASFNCIEGNFGAGVGASICGNYTFGANFSNESTATWGPGTAASRTIGGDDAASGPQESVAELDGINTVSWDGTTLILTNRRCTYVPYPCEPYPYTDGYTWTFQTTPAVVPVPAAVWLFGAALGALVPMRRRSI
jgi:hypothetical protein